MCAFPSSNEIKVSHEIEELVLNKVSSPVDHKDWEIPNVMQDVENVISLSGSTLGIPTISIVFSISITPSFFLLLLKS